MPRLFLCLMLSLGLLAGIGRGGRASEREAFGGFRLASSAATALEETENGKLKSRVMTLVRDLDADTRAVRAAAEKRLLELGPDVLPHLPPTDLLPSVSAREAVRRIRVTLEQTQARASTRPARVTLSGTMSLLEAVAAIDQQSGNSVLLDAVPPERSGKRLPVAFESTPFWDAIDAVCDQWGLDLSPTTTNGVELAPRSSDSSPRPPAATAGAFRIEVLQAEVRELPGVDEFRLVRLRLGLMSEPRLRPLFLKFGAADLRCTVREGERLTPFSPDASYEIPLGERGKHAEVRADFKAARTADLTGGVNISARLTMKTAGASTPIVFSDLSQAKNVARRRGGVTVTLKSVTVRPADDEQQDVQMAVAVSYDTAGPEFESHRTWVFHNDVFLVDSEGRRRERDGLFSTTLQTQGGVAVEYGFQGVPGDIDQYKFVYVAPTLIVDVPIEFELRNIELRPSEPR